MQRKPAVYFFALLLLLSTLVSGCGQPGGGAESTPTPTFTPLPTASPTPSTPLVILALPADMSQEEYTSNQVIVYDLAQAAGMRFQVRNTLTADDLAFEGSALKVVIALPPDPGLAVLTAAAPSVQFLAVGITDLAPAANLTSVGATGLPLDQQAFLAGYIAAMIAPEWRTGVLYQKETSAGEAARDAFANGFTYYCGSCLNPYFTQPYEAGMYPVRVGIPTDAPQSDYNGYAALLLRNFVKAAYVYPEVATPSMLGYLAQNGVMLIGQAIPDESVRSQWVVSIQPDLMSAVETIFPDLVAGHGGQTIATPLLLADINPALLTPGKQQLAQQILDGLQNGTIGTGVTP